MRTFAVDLHALVSELVRAFDHLFDSQRISAIPDAAVGDAVQADFHFGGRHRRASQVRRGQRAGASAAVWTNPRRLIGF